MARVACLWFPTLPTDRLRRFGPSPDDGRPLVTATAEHGRRVVAACSREARAAGLTPGMPLAEARVRVEGLAVVEADPAADAAWLRRFALLACRRWTPLVEIVGVDALLLEIGGAAHLAGGEGALIGRAAGVACRRGLAVRGAVAGGVGAAWALAHAAPAPLTVVPPGGDAAAIAPLPPSALRLDGEATALLARLGFATIGGLLAAPRAALARRVGAGLATRIEQAFGRRAEPLVPLVVPEPIAARRTLAEPIGSPEAIRTVIEDLAADLCDRLEAAGIGVRRAELVCLRVDAHAQAATIGLSRPSRDPAHLADLLARRIETIDPGFGIEAMTLTATAAAPLGRRQASAILSPEGEGDCVLVDRLRNRFGDRLYRAAPAESDHPTRSVARIAPLAPPCAASWRGDWPRPARLLARPEGVEHAIAGLPDHAPSAFSWRGRRHRVVAADGPERILGEWWRGGDRYRSRDYFRVELEDGGRYWLFRRGDGRDPLSGPGDWFVHGAFG